MTETKPKKFVGLHAHSNFSIGDGMDYPQEHIDYAIANGMDALALTDHGNMNGFAHQYYHWEKLKKKGVGFKGIRGNEMYFIDSLSDWDKLKEQIKIEEIKKKEAKKAKTESLIIGDDFAKDKEELKETYDSEESGGAVLENESETKGYQKYTANPLKQRNHLVVLPKNREGLYSLFKLTSLSYIDGYYFYPRVDFEMLEKHSKGNLIGLSACIGGRLSKIVFDNQIKPYEEWGINSINDNEDFIQKQIKEYYDKFAHSFGGKENFYLEIQMNNLPQQHLVNYHLIEAHKKYGLNIVMTCDSHYSKPEHWRERELHKLMAWSTKTRGEVDVNSIAKTVDELKAQLYPKNAEQIWDTYLDLKQEYPFYDDDIVSKAIEQSYAIAHDQIEKDVIEPNRSVKLPSIELLVPKNRLEQYLSDENFKTSEGETDEDKISFAELKKLSIEGLVWRKKDKDQKYIEQLKFELDTIKHLKIAKYFVTYHIIMKELQKEMITGPGRGSAAGSLVAYCLSITQIDPMKHGLLFSRFLSKVKHGLPDIDSDSSDRDKALKIITDLFGEENVVAISNYNQLQLRSLIKDLGRVYGIPFDELNRYTTLIEVEALTEAKKTPGFDRQVWILDFDEAYEKSSTFRKLLEDYPDLEKSIKILFKQIKSTSRHAGGVAITNKAYDIMPVIKSGGVIQTPWVEGLNNRHLEGLGILKFDILGLGTLRMIEETIKKILKKKTGKKFISFKEIEKWYYENLHPDNNEMDDINVYKNVYWEGKWAGIFQFVNDTAQNFIKNLKPTSINDICIATSVCRPGPLGAGVDKLLIKNKNDEFNIAYKHPFLKDVLSETYGCIIYQENLQMIYHKLAGVPMEETDMVRKAFTKKDISNKEKAAEERKKLKDEFVIKCKSANDIPEYLSSEIFDELEKYVSYSFNKSHAMSYAMISYMCAYLLTHYPDEWVTSYIDYCIHEKGNAGKEDPKEIALGEAKQLGYSVGKCDINKSGHDYTCENKTLIPSITSLQYVGKTVLSELEDFRPYGSIEDLLWHSKPILGSQTGEMVEEWKHSKLNKRALSSLIKMESFDSMDIVGEGKLVKNYKQLHYILVDKSEEIKKALSRKKNRNHKEILQKLIEEAQGIEDWSRSEKMTFQKEISGTIDKSLLLSPKTRELLEKYNAKPIHEWESEKQIYWAILENATIKQTIKTGKDFLHMTLKSEDFSTHTCKIWNFKKDSFKISPGDIIVGVYKKDNFGLSTFVNKIYKLNQEA